MEGSAAGLFLIWCDSQPPRAKMRATMPSMRPVLFFFTGRTSSKALVSTVTFAAIIYVVIPGALLLFYRSYHVRRTCEVRDPQQRWTDRCPLPVLIMCLLQISGSLCFLIMPRFWSVIPFFGTLVTGWPARLLWIILIIVSLCAARGFYRLNFHAWLVYLLTVVACLTSTGITFIHIELIDYYRAIDLPEWHLEMMAKNPLATGNYAFASTILSPVAFVGYLIYLRRYFTTR